MKQSIYIIAILLLLSSFTFAQQPVLFDGVNPVVLSFDGPSGQDALPANDPIPQSQLITPEQLNHLLNTAKHKPLILNIGPRSMFSQAHIPDAEYMGASSTDAGQQKLKDRVKPLPKNAAIVLYCGCCPWSHCPNVHPAYQLLHSLGYSNVKVLYITGDFGTDWASKGYPTAKGE
jgi:thiosulfate/3-mercaptopyruvate sulfurtransferase